MSSMSYRDVAASLRAGQHAPIYLLTGAESYLRDRLIAVMEDSLVEPSMRSIDRQRFHGPVQMDALDRAIRTPAMLSKAKLLLLDQPAVFYDSKADVREAFEAIFSSIPEGLCLVLIEAQLDKRYKRLKQAFEKAGGCHVALALQDAGTLKRWMASLCDAQEKRIAAEAAEMLIERCDGSMGAIKMELDKVLAYGSYLKLRDITPDMIDQLCRPDLGGDIFKLTDAVSAGKAEVALGILHRLLIRREPLPLIRFMLARHLRQLLVAKDSQDSRELYQALKTRPFVADRLRRQMRRFQRRELEAHYQLCVETDEALKSRSMDERLAVELLIAKLAGN